MYLQEAFWRIPGELTVGELRSIQEGLTIDDDGKATSADKLQLRQTRPGREKMEKKTKVGYTGSTRKGNVCWQTTGLLDLRVSFSIQGLPEKGISIKMTNDIIWLSKSLYPPATKLVGVYWNHPVRL